MAARPVILISCLGLGLDSAFMAVAPSLTLLFVGRVISGITSAIIGTGFAYIADVTPAQDRARAFGLVGVAFGLGFVVAPALGGLLGGIEPRLPFWVAAAACLLNAGFGWFIRPESLPPERRMADLRPGADRRPVPDRRAGDVAVGAVGASILGMMKRLVSPSEQGQLQGANTSLTSVAGLFGPSLFAAAFSLMLTTLPGAAFNLSALILLAALGVAAWATRPPPDVDRPR